MPAPYPLPQNVTGMADLGEYANIVTGNLWGVAILLATVIIIYAVLNLRFSNRIAVAGTATIASVLGILWRFAGQINDSTMFFVIGGSFLAILYLFFTRED